MRRIQQLLICALASLTLLGCEAMTSSGTSDPRRDGDSRGNEGARGGGEGGARSTDPRSGRETTRDGRATTPNAPAPGGGPTLGAGSTHTGGEVKGSPPSGLVPLTGICVQIGHTTLWTEPAVTTKLGAAPVAGEPINDAYIGLRLKTSSERTEPNFSRNIQGGNVGGEAASWTSDIIVRLRVDADDLRLGRDFRMYAASPAHNGGGQLLKPVERGGREFDVLIPANRPGAVAWVGFHRAAPGPPRALHLEIVAAWEASELRPVPVGWNDKARFVLEPAQRDLRVTPVNDPRGTFVQFASVPSVPHRPHISGEVVSERNSEHRWMLELRDGNMESRPGSGQIGGKRARLAAPINVVFSVDKALSTAEYGRDFMFIDGYGGKAIQSLRGSTSWRVRIPAGESSVPIYVRFLGDKDPDEGWEQVVIEIKRVEPGRVGIGWNKKVRWLIEDFTRR